MLSVHVTRLCANEDDAESSTSSSDEDGRGPRGIGVFVKKQYVPDTSDEDDSEDYDSEERNDRSDN